MRKSSHTFVLESDSELGKDADDGKTLNKYGCTCKATVLLVDDNPFNLMAMRVNLR